MTVEFIIFSVEDGRPHARVRTALEAASYQGVLEMKHNRSMSQRRLQGASMYKDEPIHAAAYNADLEQLEFNIEWATDVDAPDSYDTTALGWILIQAVGVSLDNDPRCKNEVERSALSAKLYQCYLALIQAGASLSTAMKHLDTINLENRIEKWLASEDEIWLLHNTAEVKSSTLSRRPSRL